MKSFENSIALAAFFALSMMGMGCGSSDENDDSAKEFAKNIDHVIYDLKELNISASLAKDSSSRPEELNKSISESTIRDKIERIIKGPSFLVVINDVEAGLQVSSAGKINHQGTLAEKGPACELTGSSRVTGVATSLKFEIEWELNAEIQGESCDAAMLTKFAKFQSDELEVFHLKSVKAVLDSAELPRDSQKKVHIALRIVGDSH